LRAVVHGLGLPKYRAAQIAEALYKQRVTELAEITTLPAPIRQMRFRRGGFPSVRRGRRSSTGSARWLPEPVAYPAMGFLRTG